MRTVIRLVICTLLMLVTTSIALAADPNFDKMTMTELYQFATEHQLSIGDPQTKAELATVVKAEWAKVQAASGAGTSKVQADMAKQEAAEHILPDGRWFRPTLPNPETNETARRGISVIAIILGMGAWLAFIVVLYFTVIFLVEVSRGAMAPAKIAEGIGIRLFVLLMLVIFFGGGMYEFGKAAVTFFRDAISGV